MATSAFRFADHRRGREDFSRVCFLFVLATKTPPGEMVASPNDVSQETGHRPSSIFAQPNATETWAQHERIVEQLESRFPDAAKLLEEAREDILAFTAFPKEHWRQIWSNNPQERLNREVRRRTDVVGIFPDRDAIIRLVGAVLAEQHDEWAVARRYMSPELLANAGEVTDTSNQLEEGDGDPLDEIAA